MSRGDERGGDDDVVMVGPRSGLVYRRIRPEWAERLEELEMTIFATADPDELTHASEFAAMAHDFPEGGFAGFDGDEIVALGVGVRKHFHPDDPPHRFVDVQPPGRGSGDEPDGEWYYGTSIAVAPSYRGRGVGGELYELRKGTCRALGLAGIVAGGVVPGYAAHKDTMSIDEYIDAVRRRELRDPTLTFQLDQGFEAVGALPDYLADPETDSYAVLIVWRNPDAPGR